MNMWRVWEWDYKYEYAMYLDSRYGNGTWVCVNIWICSRYGNGTIYEYANVTGMGMELWVCKDINMTGMGMGLCGCTMYVTFNILIICLSVCLSVCPPMSI